LTRHVSHRADDVAPLDDGVAFARFTFGGNRAAFRVSIFGKIGLALMTESAELDLTPPMPTPEAIAAVRCEPRFRQALAAVVVSSIEFYQGRWLADRVLNDRARFGMATLIMFLHFNYRPGMADSGLTAARLREICVGAGVCSGGRVESMLLMMRAGGFLERAAESDRHVRRDVPTAKLIALHRERHRQILSALDILRGQSNHLVRICGGPEDGSYRHFIIAMGRAFLAGYRVVDSAPELRKIVDRDAGLPLMMCVLLASPDYAALVPEEMRPVSVAGLARRFSVTRIHVRSVLRDAESSGLLIRHGDTEPVTALPALIGAMENFFASAFVMGESCAHIALAQEV
jgi:hypothetical protein